MKYIDTMGVRVNSREIKGVQDDQNRTHGDRLYFALSADELGLLGLVAWISAPDLICQASPLLEEHEKSS